MTDNVLITNLEFIYVKNSNVGYDLKVKEKGQNASPITFSVFDYFEMVLNNTDSKETLKDLVKAL